MAGTSDQSSIKSKAVVKFGASHLPDTFNKLEPQTDLHQGCEIRIHSNPKICGREKMTFLFILV